ncbi:MAG TPA: hypothetical protein VL426_04735, partial [Candidatus Binatia bacterium]|nr:hypothetical protein [Candidatus Binatia bacterium]
MRRKADFLHHYVELFVILFAVAVLGFLAGGPQGIDQTLTAGAATCPILDGGTGDDDAVANGVITISSSKTFSAITGTYDCTATPFQITSSGTLILDTNTATGQIAQVNFGSLTVDIGGVIHSNTRGCPGDASTGNGPNASNVCTDGGAGGGVSGGNVNSGGGGAGYGGAGGSGAGTTPGAGGVTYGSATAPALFGSSGAGTQGVVGSEGGAGGGVVRFTVTGTLVQNGTITANGSGGNNIGGSGRAGGGGTGGSIFVTAGTLNGAGTFEAKGGAGGDSIGDGGGGGGGRIAVIHGGGSYAFNAAKFDVSGGTAPGSAVAGTKGTVYVKNTASNAVSIFHGFTYDDTDHFVSTWTADASATNQYCDITLGSGATPSVHTTSTLSFGGSFSCPTSIASFTLDAASTLSFDNGSSLSVNGAMFLSANTAFSMGTGVTVSTTKTNSDLEFNVPAGSTQTWSGLTVNVGSEGEFIT